MSLQVTTMERVFTLPDKTELKDPNPDLSPDEVIKHYSAIYPDITNGSVEKIERVTRGGKEIVVYTMSRNPGRLG